MLGSLAPARRRLVLACGIAAAVVVLGAGAALAGHRAARASGPVPQNVPGPVLLVPGYGGSITSLRELASALRATGRTVEIVALPDNAEGDLQAQARTLRQAATAAMRGAGATSVDVVGYSAGGVVARLWARFDGGAAQARRIVTLGSPHHGTELASLGALLPSACPVACQQLAPQSALLQRLNSGVETPAGPVWESVWTTADEVVLPPDSARLAGATDLSVQSICPSDRVSHGGLPADPVVTRVVIAALGPSFAVPAAGC